MEELIIRYINGEKISKEEIQSLKVWLSNPENKKYFKEIIKTNQQLNITLSPIDIKNAYQNVRREILNESNNKSINPYKRIFKYAALLLLFISVSYATYFSFFRVQIDVENETTLLLSDGTLKKIGINTNQKITDKAGNIIAKVEDNTLIIQSNDVNSKDNFYKLNIPFGKKAKVELPDNTLVTLNSGSQLQFPISFAGRQNREVFLEGEGYFNVTKNVSSPFIVRTANMDVRVLGTRFNLSSYNNDDITFVALEEGSVAVNLPLQPYNKNTSLTIVPGEQVVFKKNSLSIQKTNIKKDIAWSKGELFFENDRFEDIIKELERHYNIIIENKSINLNDIRYTGTFTNETINEVFETFKELSEFEYEIVNERIVISTH